MASRSSSPSSSRSRPSRSRSGHAAHPQPAGGRCPSGGLGLRGSSAERLPQAVPSCRRSWDDGSVSRRARHLADLGAQDCEEHRADGRTTRQRRAGGLTTADHDAVRRSGTPPHAPPVHSCKYHWLHPPQPHPSFRTERGQSDERGRSASQPKAKRSVFAVSAHLLCWFPGSSMVRFGRGCCVEPQLSVSRLVRRCRKWLHAASGRLQTAAILTNPARRGRFSRCFGIAQPIVMSSML